MSESPETPTKQPIDGDGATVVPGTPSSETQDDDGLQHPSILESPVQDEAHTNVPEPAGDDGSVSDKESSQSSTADVPSIDWVEFESEYKRALTNANDVEDKLVLEFEKLSKAFVFWAEASAQHDNDRAWKRLKTRERYVQLSEQRLDEKKKHYVEVVQAFQSALKLLGA